MDANLIFSIGLGLEAPWRILSSNLDINVNPHRLDLRVEAERGALYPCPECGKLCKAHDFAERTWRHLNFFQHHCYVTAPVPRTDCPEHGIKTVTVPWARKGSAFTMFFEAMVMLLARQMPVAVLARYAQEHDTRLWRVIEHYVAEAVSQMDLGHVKAVGLDETAGKRGHNYVTVFIDMERKEKPVLFVTPGKGKDTLAKFRQHLERQGGKAERVLEVVCDMSGAFIEATREHFENAQTTIDWFHVTALVSRAMDEVRRAESKQDKLPKHLRYAILKNPDTKMTEEQAQALHDLEQSNLATAQAYRCKESLAWVRQAESHQGAAWRMTRFVGYWLQELKAGIFEPLKRALSTIAGYRSLILRRWKSTYSNARLEGMNGLFQAARARARGYRNTSTFMTMIYLIGAPLGKILSHFTRQLAPTKST
ncbi:MAG: ISL3 family transposase [Planctomycetes bacterium]|nr:ISL3 family transposase [Planctomycetota bacterium]